jgi:hypothetical protein
MSGGPPKEAAKPSAQDQYIELAQKIYINLAARVYGTLSGTEQKKPDPKALAAFCFKLAGVGEAAITETDRMKASIEAANKAKVKLDDVDLSSVFASTKKP